jgi:hypothetical protein
MSSTDIGKTSVADFCVGRDDVDTTAKPVPCPPKIIFQKGLRIRAALTNTGTIYVGNEGVTPDSGYPLLAGEELFLEVEKAGKVYVVAALPGNTYSWIGT